MIYIRLANLTSAASVQANKQNNSDVRTGLRGRACAANTDIKTRQDGENTQGKQGQSSEAGSRRNIATTEAWKGRKSTFLREEKK